MITNTGELTDDDDDDKTRTGKPKYGNSGRTGEKQGNKSPES